MGFSGIQCLRKLQPWNTGTKENWLLKVCILHLNFLVFNIQKVLTEMVLNARDVCTFKNSGVYDGLTSPFSSAGAWIGCLSCNQVFTTMKPMRIKHLWTVYFLTSNDFKNYFWDRGSHTHRLCNVHHETPCTISPLGFGLKWVLHKEAQQQLREIFKFLLACYILETYAMQTFGTSSKRFLKMPKISVKLENLKCTNTAVMRAGSCCAFTLGPRPAQFVHS